MSDSAMNSRATIFKIGFWILVLTIAGNAAGRLLIHFYDKDLVTLVWAEYSLLGAVVLLIPYRRLEKWAWYAIWVLAVSFGLMTFYLPNGLGSIFLILAFVIAISQLLTYRAFSRSHIKSLESS